MRGRYYRMTVALLLSPWVAVVSAEREGVPRFREDIQPILAKYCVGCHNPQATEGGVSFGRSETDGAWLQDQALWLRAYKQLRSGLMPPAGEDQPTEAERATLQQWIKSGPFAIDPAHPDPGRVTVRRLNRTEYRNTIRDLVGIDFDAALAFPPDDTGHGFDNIGDVLTMSPVMLEKYIDAAKLIVEQVIPPAPGAAAESWRSSKFYERYFPRDIPPGVDERRETAAKILGEFATRAVRRPVELEATERLVRLAESVYRQQGKTFEAGIAQGMIAILASPRFLFREEGAATGASASEPFPLLDEYALAARMSYFLWSSMPDEELLQLASAGQLRAKLNSQLQRMMGDRRSEQLIRNFVGQWLQSRDIESANINAFAVLSRENRRDPDAERRRERFRELRRKESEELSDAEKAELEQLRNNFTNSFRRFKDFELTGDLRRAMRHETEMMVAYVLKEDRSVLEILDADYTFLNERLAKHYGIEGVQGDEMRRVALPSDSPRGGVLTQGTTLIVTSNPDRTSPVKRGLFILNNLLGTPPAPPPPDVPALEESEKSSENLTLREALAIHREKAICSSCHDRMDPLGLAFENFNALGRWRDTERGQTLDPKGTLITGEPFEDIRHLKKVLVTARRKDFYYCLTERLLTYALGRGLEYYDVEAVDRIVDQLMATDGRASVLMEGIVRSVPFQRTRLPDGER